MKGEAAEQDIVWHVRALLIRLRVADQGGPRDLRHGSHDVANHKPPQDQFRAQDAGRLGIEACPRGPADERAEADVQAGGDEHGRRDDAEILHDEIDDVVRVLARRERAEDVADDFHDAGEGEGGEGPDVVFEDLDEVEDEGKQEEDDG